jgi:hypothetical protein
MDHVRREQYLSLQQRQPQCHKLRASDGVVLDTFDVGHGPEHRLRWGNI